MSDSTQPKLRILAGLLLQNQRSFIVRRCVQRFLARELTARKAMERIRRHLGVVDNDPCPFD